MQSRREWILLSGFVCLALIISWVYMEKNKIDKIVIDSKDGVRIEGSTKEGSSKKGSSQEGTLKEGSSMNGTQKEGSVASSSEGATMDMENIQIYVVGAVKNPGVVAVKKGTILAEVVELAGGFTEDADKMKVNLVYALYENAMLRIPSIQEQQVQTNQSYPDQTLSTSIIETGDMGVVINGNGETQEAGQKRVNINLAGEDELKTLPGIGEVYAKRIVAYRKQNGKFKDKEELMQISGIGPSTMEKIRDQITLQ